MDVHYFVGGKGEPLVIVHGGAGGGAQGWLQRIDELCQHFTVYIPDLPGFGLSQPLNGSHDINEFVEFLNNFTSSIGLESFYLAGHSIGGGIALRYAVKFKHKVKKLVLINGIGVGNKIATWVHLMSYSGICLTLGISVAASLRAIKWVVNKAYAPFRFINPLPLAAVLLGASMTIFRQEANLLIPQFAALMIPTLLVWGARDRIVPVSNAYAAARLIPGCQVHIFKNHFHLTFSTFRTEKYTPANNFVKR